MQLQFLDIEFAGDGVRCYSDRLDVYDGARLVPEYSLTSVEFRSLKRSFQVFSSV